MIDELYPVIKQDCTNCDCNICNERTKKMNEQIFLLVKNQRKVTQNANSMVRNQSILRKRNKRFLIEAGLWTNRSQ